jgi:hypothetical protein
MSMQRVLWCGCFLATGLAALLVNASAAQEKGSSQKGLEQAWSLEGTWTGVVSDEGKGAIYTIGRGDKCVELDLAGKQQREIKLAESKGSILRIATFPGAVGKALLTFSVWGEELRAYDLSGKQLWSYPRETGIDDVWARDLNGDGSDEVIIGYNGGTGLHVLDGMGKLLWKSTAIGNVWHVCAGDVLGEGKPQVVTTSAAGKVHVFDGGGKQSKDLDAGCYANMVRIGKLSEKDKAAMIVVAGSALGGAGNQKTAILTSMSGQGDKKWSLELPAGSPPHVDSAQLAPGKPWLAVGMRGGQVHVVDLEKGEIIASANDQGMTPEVGWASGKDPGAPLLLVATSSKLNAFRVAKSK